MHGDPDTTRPTNWSAIQVLLIVLELFLALGAFFGGGMMVLARGGGELGLPPELLEGSGFASYRVPGVILVLANGVLPVAVAIAAIRGRSWARYGHVLVGCVLTGWIVVQGILIGFGHWLQISYLVMGLVIAGLGLVGLRRGRRAGA